MPRKLMDLTPHRNLPRLGGGKPSYKVEKKFATRVKPSWYRGTPTEIKELFSLTSDHKIVRLIDKTRLCFLNYKEPHCKSFTRDNPITCDMPYYCLDCAKRISYRRAKDWTAKIIQAATIFKDYTEYDEDYMGCRIIEPEYRNIWWLTYGYFRDTFGNKADNPETYRRQLEMVVEHAKKAGYYAAILHSGIGHKRPTYAHVHAIIICDDDLIKPEGFRRTFERRISTQDKNWQYELEKIVRYMLKYPVTDYFSGVHKNDRIDANYIKIAEAFQVAKPFRTVGALANHSKSPDDYGTLVSPSNNEFLAHASQITNDTIQS